MKLKATLSYTLAAALLTSAAIPAAFADGDTVVLQLFGERNWTVSCQMQQADGDTIDTSDRGRRGQATGRIVVRDVQMGRCDYMVPENGMLRLTLVTERTNLECPFEMTEAGYCRAYFSGGMTGSFDIRQAAGSDNETGS